MHYITFHCRTISPMFIGGAYSDEAELRPPSVKGALRFWARAIAKHWIWDDRKENHQKLLKHDEELFGGVRMHQGKNLVSVEIRHDALRTIGGSSLPSVGPGLKYLLFTLAVHSTNTKKQGIEAGFSFLITFRSKNQDALQKAIAAFWALTYLGSLGTRARRGAGAFEVINHEGFDLPLGISFNPGNNLVAFLRKGTLAISNSFDVPAGTQTPKEYSTLGQKVWVSKNHYKTWEAALEEIGLLLYNHRKAIPNKDRTKRKFTMDTLNQKAAFGLPLGVYEDDSVNFGKRNDADNSRRSSPLYITLARGDLGIFWIVTHFEGVFMDANDQIIFKSKNRQARCKTNHYWDQEDPSLLLQFTKKLDTEANKIY